MSFHRSGFILGILAGVGLCVAAHAGTRSSMPYGGEGRASEVRPPHVAGAPIAVGHVLAVTQAASTTPALQWAWGNPKPSGDVFEAVAYGGGVYVAVGTGGVIYSSTDGVHWTKRDSGLPTGFSYFDVYYAAGLFIAGGTGSDLVTHITTSPDGVTWTDHVPALAKDQIADHIGYGNGTYLAVNSVALTSTDGITWHEHGIESLANSPFFDSPAYANGVFVTMGNDSTANNVLYYSDDAGVTWHHAATSIPNTDFMLALASNGSGFVITGIDETFAGAQNGVTYTSTDGNTWTRHGGVGDGDGFFYPTLWDGSHYVTVSEVFGAGGNGPANVYTSTDGASWAKGAAAALSSGFAGSHHPIAWTGNSYVATAIQNLQIQSSASYAHWNTSFKGASGPTGNLGTAAFLNGHYFAAGPAVSGTAQSILESDDGIAWSGVFSSSSETRRLGVLAYGNGIYVAVGDAGTGYTSSDGKHWSAMLTPPAFNVFGLAYGAGKFVSVGLGRVATSADGKTWVTDSSFTVTGDAITGLAYTGTHFVAVTDDFFGDGVFALASTDGLSWAPTPLSAPTGVGFDQLHLAGDRLVAAGYLSDSGGVQGYLATSTDGVSWHGAASGQFGLRFAEAAYDGSNYYVTPGPGFSGLVLTSSDGATWKNLDGVPVTAQINAMVYNDGRFVTAGDGGDLLAAEVSGPTAGNGSVSTASGTPVSGTLIGSGATGAVLVFSIVTQPTHGKVTLTNAATGAFKYTPDSGFTGKDTFSFEVSDGIADSAAATESVTVDASGGGGGGGAFGLLLLAGLLGAVVARRR